MQKRFFLLFILCFTLFVNTPAQAQDCTGSLASNLSVGMQSRVLDGNTLNLRTVPETGTIVAVMPAGSEFQIVGDAICGAQNGLRWWQINWNGEIGYITDGDINEFWISQPPAMFGIPSADNSNDESVVQSVIFNDLYTQEESDGVRFQLDVTITGYGNQNLSIYLWLVDSVSNNYLENPNAQSSYINSSNILYLTSDLVPCCDSVTYSPDDIDLFIPYSQLPEGNISFYPQVTIYDSEQTLIEEQSFWDAEIQTSASAIGAASIDSVSYQFADEGIWFLVDMTVRDRANENLQLYLWLIDTETNEYISKPSSRIQDDILSVSLDIPVSSNDAQYSGTDLALYIPYHDFPRGNYDYVPFVVLYDSSDNEITQYFDNDLVITASNHPFPSSGVLIRDIDYSFEDAGVRYWIDLETLGYANQELSVAVFFRFYDDTYIQSALPMNNLYSNDTGSITSSSLIIPCCDERLEYSGDYRVEVYVPYNVFPVGTYSYYPVVSVAQSSALSEALGTRFFRNETIEVLGDEDPAGYIVNFSIHELYAVNPFNNTGMANSGPNWDNLLLTYGIYEIDSTGEVLPGAPYYWLDQIAQGGLRYEDFDIILLDVLADSEMRVQFSLTDVADMDETQEFVDNLRGVGDVAGELTRFIPRAFRNAAKAAGSYVNGMLLIYDIQAFFDEDIEFATYEETISSDELLYLYQITGESGESWTTQTMSIESYYEITAQYWLYGYARHQSALDN